MVPWSDTFSTPACEPSCQFSLFEGTRVTEDNLQASGERWLIPFCIEGLSDIEKVLTENRPYDFRSEMHASGLNTSPPKLYHFVIFFVSKLVCNLM